MSLSLKGSYSSKVATPIHRDNICYCLHCCLQGILITSAKVLHAAGPGGGILAYVLTGTVAWSVIASLGEMTALMPVKAPIVEFASRYVDSAVGFATGWMYWFVVSGLTPFRTTKCPFKNPP